MTRDQQVAAGAIVEDRGWLGKLRGELEALLAPVFLQARPRLTAFAYIGALLAEYAWDWRQALTAVQRFIVARLAGPEAVLAVDETAELNKGAETAGAARQHAGITGQAENCQTVVVAAHVASRGHAPSDFRLYLPRSWCADRERRQRAHVPDDAVFTTKPVLGAQMVTGAAGSGVPFAWVAADELYGRSSTFRQSCEQAGQGYVLAVPVSLAVTLPSGRKTAVSALVPAAAWETRSGGRGCTGHRDHAWAWAGTASPRHWVLIRRSLADPADLAFFFCHVPEGRPASLPALIAAAGTRWPAQECHQQGKGQAGLDQHQVRTWHSLGRHTVLSIRAQALLAVAAARPAPHPPGGGSPGGQPATPANCPSPRTTTRPATTLAWSRSASPKPAACSAWPPGP